MRALMVVLSLLPSLALAQVPQTLGYQGRLLKADGQPEQGTVAMTFRLFRVETAGPEIWKEAQTLALTDGFYATHLGKVVPFGTGVFDGGDLYLEVTVGAETLSPRHKVASVAYALVAGSARGVSGGAVDATSVTVGGKPVIDSAGQLSAASGAAFAPQAHTHPAADVVSGTLALARIPNGSGSNLDADLLDGKDSTDFALSLALSSPGTVNAAANPVDWTKLKNVPPGLASGGALALTAPLSGSGTSASPLSLAAASTTADGYLSRSDFQLFSGKLALVAARAPLTGTGTAANPLGLKQASASDDGYLSSLDYQGFAARLLSVTVQAPFGGAGTAAAPLSMSVATDAVDGYLSAADHAAFASKLSSVSVAGPLSGSGSASSPLAMPAASASADGYLSATDYRALSGKLSSVAATAPLSGNGSATSPLALARASGSVDGFLASPDFATFNGKLGAVTASAPLVGAGTSGSPLALGKASSGSDGYLAAADFSSFSGKLGAVTAAGPLSGAGTSSSPLTMGKATGAVDGYLAAADHASFSARLSSVAVAAPLTGNGIAGSPVSLAPASATSPGFVTAVDWSKFNGKVSSVSAGTGLAASGTATAPSLAVVYGNTAGTAAEGNDPRLSDARPPVAGNNGYIQNQTGADQAASLRIQGTATVGGTVTAPRFAGQADTANGFATCANITLASARDYTTLNAQLDADYTGAGVCGATSHVCNTQEVTIYGVMTGCGPGGQLAWVVGGFSNTEFHRRSAWNGQDSVQCAAGSYPTWYGTYWGPYRGRIHCIPAANSLVVACCKNL